MLDGRSEGYPTGLQQWLITSAEIPLFVLKIFPVKLLKYHTLLQISSFRGICLCSITLVKIYNSFSNAERHFPEYLASDMFKNKSRCLLKIFKYLLALMCNINF